MCLIFNIFSVRKTINKLISLLGRASNALQPLASDGVNLGRAILNQAVGAGNSKQSSKSAISNQINRMKRNINNASQKLVPIANEAVGEGLKLYKVLSRMFM